MLEISKMCEKYQKWKIVKNGCRGSQFSWIRYVKNGKYFRNTEYVTIAENFESTIFYGQSVKDFGNVMLNA